MSDENQVLCHLCYKYLPKINWTIEKHRGKCANDHMHILIMFQHHQDIYCPKCDGPMLFWPKKGPLTFKCAKSQKTFLNDGQNRLCCFYCDYNLALTRNEIQIPNERINVEDDEEPPPDYDAIIL